MPGALPRTPAALATTPTMAPADIDTMRHTVSRFLGPDARPPVAEHLITLYQLMRGHMQLLIPEVERAALKRKGDDVPRYVALACVREARRKLQAPAEPDEHRVLVHARRLARSLAAVCDHYEALTDVAMCLACDQVLRDGEDAQPYDHVSPSGPVVRVGRIHTRCANTYRRYGEGDEDAPTVADRVEQTATCPNAQSPSALLRRTSRGSA